jgi:hypothetical protein
MSTIPPQDDTLMPPSEEAEAAETLEGADEPGQEAGDNEPVTDPLDPKEQKERAAKKVAKRRKVAKLKDTKSAPETLSIKVPAPFRPSHLTEMIDAYRREAKIADPGDKRLKGWHFLQAFGLPKPRRAIAVQGYVGKDNMPIKVYEAVDESEAISFYASELINPQEHHRYKFRTVIRAE